MMPVTEIWVRMLPKLSSVAKEGLAAAKKLNRQISVRNGAMLRIWERSIAASPRGRFRSAATVTLSPEVMPVSSRRFQRRSLLICSLANSRTTAPRLSTMTRSASDSTVSGSVESTMMASPLARRSLTMWMTSFLAPTSMPRVGSHSTNSRGG